MRTWPGRPYPLGATWDGAGVNFALFSEQASKVELCLFDAVDATHEAQTIPEPGQTFIFHGHRFQVLRRQRNQITSIKVSPPLDFSEEA